MAQATIDASLCTGCGLCVSSCPEAFDIGDDNVAYVKESTGDCNLDEAAESCPVEAIKVTE